MFMIYSFNIIIVDYVCVVKVGSKKEKIIIKIII